MATPTRLTGLLLFWHLSHTGGFGKILVPHLREQFFLHRDFIQSGDPLPGCCVTFTPAPAAEGKPHRRAMEAVVHPPDKRITALKALDLLAKKDVRK